MHGGERPRKRYPEAAEETQPHRAVRPAGAAAKLAGGKPSHHGRQFLLRSVLVGGFAVANLIFGVAVHLIVRDLTMAWAGTGVTPFRFGGQVSTPGARLELPGTPPPPLPAVEPQPWSGFERVTVLIMGLDERDLLARQGPGRTDSMMVISYDPLTQRASMLSIPRDLYVEIPGFGHDRINTAYPKGEASRLPGGGPALAMQTVESVIGVPIQYYMIIHFSAFERMIDEIGGIDVLVTERIKISPIGRPSVWLEAKAYHLDGAEALAYARARTGPQGDFARARRQQQVALAILDRLLSIDVIPTLFARAPILYHELSRGIQTNLTLDQMVSLGWTAYRIPRDRIHSGVIAPPNMVGFHTLPGGANVLRPVPDQIRALRDQLFVDTSALTPNIQNLLPAGSVQQ